jgi:hypothetical protein
MGPCQFVVVKTAFGCDDKQGKAHGSAMCVELVMVFFN